MQIEKKLILCSVLAVAIGIATIIPLQYLMNTETASAMLMFFFEGLALYRKLRPKNNK